MAAWVADRVLPFLAKRSDDDSEDSEKSQPQPLAAEITEVSSTVHFVNMCLYLFFFSFFLSRGLKILRHLIWSNKENVCGFH